MSCREQAKAASLTCSVIAVDAGALVVPGERRLFDVPEQQLEQIIADKGQVRCPGKAGSSSACTAILEAIAYVNQAMGDQLKGPMISCDSSLLWAYHRVQATAVAAAIADTFNLGCTMR
jgi:hypothetical protein